MSKVQMLRALVQQRLTAAAEEIFGLFERTIAEYEEELCRSKEENERQQKLLDAVFNPQLRLHRADVQQLLVVKEEVPPEQQECSSSLDQELQHIKEEQQDFCSSQEGEQLQDHDITKFISTSVPVKSEDDEEKPQSSQFQQRQTDSSETDYSDGDWEETREPHSGLNSLKVDEISVSDSRCSAGEKLFKCSECGKRFGRKGNLKRHMITHTGEKPFSCSVCQKTFAQSGHLQKHMRIHTGEKPFSCSICSKSFTQKVKLTNHMTHHTGRKPFSCSVCKKLFTERGNLRTHMRIHTGENPFSCSVCGKSFKQKGILTDHMKLHTGEKAYSCKVCKKRFTWRYQLRRHRSVCCQSSQLHQTETEETKEAGPPASNSTEQVETEADGEDCGGPEPDRNSDPDAYLQPVSDDETGDTSEPETDDSADWKETRDPQSGSDSLKAPVSDLRCSADEKPFSCSECDKDFGSSGNLKRHMRCHTGEKPYRCPLCKKSFAQGGSLRLHMRIHTGEKPYSCPFCKKSFAQGGSLRLHMRIHTGEKPYNCSVCGDRFIQKVQLTQHMAYHTGDKPFSCTICNRSFMQKISLINHMTRHTGEKLYSCSVCHKRFASRPWIKKHKCVGHQSSQLHQYQTEENREAEPGASSSTEQVETEADGENCGGPEPDRNSHLVFRLGSL